MGPASIAAEIFRPQTTDTLAAQSKKAAADDNRFEDYLDEAQGVNDARESDDVEKSDTTSERDAPTDSDDRADDGTEAAAQVAGQAAVAQTIVTDAPIEASNDGDENAAARIEAASVASSEKPIEAASQADARGDASQAIDSAAGREATADQIQQADASTKREAVSANEAARQPADSESRAAQALKEAASAPTDKTESVLRTDVESDADTSDDVIRPVRVDRPVETTANADKESGVRAAIGEANKSHESNVPRESIQQRKVREATDARRVEAANAAANEPQKKKADKNDGDVQRGGAERSPRAVGRGAGESVGAGKKPGAFQARLDAANGASRVSTTTTDTASIKTGVGDSAAVSAARFLISPQTAVSQSTIQPATGNTSGAGAFASAIEASSGSANTIVSDLLAGGADKSGGVDGMARVLNASGVPGKYQATLRLDPPSMGTVRVQLNLQQEGLSIQVDTQSKHVSKLIESRLDDLREALSAHGIRVERADVVTKSPENAEASDRHENSANHFDQSSAEDADYSMPRDAQGRSDSSFTGARWGDDGESADLPISDTSQDTLQSLTDRDVGAQGIVPGAVDLVA